MAKKIRNLVLGSSGVIGSSFVRFLEKKGEEVIPFDIKRSKKEDARYAKLPLKNVDYVYFIAWDVGGAKYIFGDSLVHQLEWNVHLLENVMPQLAKAGVPFFFLSSQYAEEYGSPYGSTKRLGEIWTKLIPNGYYGRNWNVFGAYEEMTERSKVITDFIYQALTTKKIKMMTNGHELRQFVHIDDCCRAYYTILHNRLNKGVYDITSYRWTSVREIANIIASHTGAKVFPGKKEGFSHLGLPSHDKIPGWYPKVRLEDGLKVIIEQYRKQLKAEGVIK